MSTAKVINRVQGSVQAVYEMDPPYMENEHVLVSADGLLVQVPETYIFPKNGDVTSYLELPGSFRGAMDHSEALENAGYKII